MLPLGFSIGQSLTVNVFCPTGRFGLAWYSSGTFLWGHLSLRTGLYPDLLTVSDRRSVTGRAGLQPAVGLTWRCDVMWLWGGQEMLVGWPTDGQTDPLTDRLSWWSQTPQRWGYGSYNWSPCFLCTQVWKKKRPSVCQTWAMARCHHDGMAGAGKWGRNCPLCPSFHPSVHPSPTHTCTPARTHTQFHCDLPPDWIKLKEQRAKAGGWFHTGHGPALSPLRSQPACPCWPHLIQSQRNQRSSVSSLNSLLPENIIPFFSPLE